MSADLSAKLDLEKRMKIGCLYNLSSSYLLAIVVFIQGRTEELCKHLSIPLRGELCTCLLISLAMLLQWFGCNGGTIQNFCFYDFFFVVTLCVTLHCQLFNFLGISLFSVFRYKILDIINFFFISITSIQCRNEKLFENVWAKIQNSVRFTSR